MTTTKKINHGSVKLTRENITQGRLGDKIRSSSDLTGLKEIK